MKGTCHRSGVYNDLTALVSVSRLPVNSFDSTCGDERRGINIIFIMTINYVFQYYISLRVCITKTLMSTFYFNI